MKLLFTIVIKIQVVITKIIIKKNYENYYKPGSIGR